MYTVYSSYSWIPFRHLVACLACSSLLLLTLGGAATIAATSLTLKEVKALTLKEVKLSRFQKAIWLFLLSKVKLTLSQLFLSLLLTSDWSSYLQGLVLCHIFVKPSMKAMNGNAVSNQGWSFDHPWPRFIILLVKLTFPSYFYHWDNAFSFKGWSFDYPWSRCTVVPYIVLYRSYICQFLKPS